jgi:hypothetical protein
MAVPFEQEYEDILQNIEFAIVGAYRESPEITDWTVEAALDGLIRGYQAEASGRAAPVLRLAGLEQQLYSRVREMCEWRLGRRQLILTADEQQELPEIPPKTVQEIVACLKRVRTSVKRWHKSGGRRGYLDFVSQYIG